MKRWDKLLANIMWKKKTWDEIRRTEQSSFTVLVDNLPSTMTKG